MICSKCGAELENNALVCPACGQAVPDEMRIQAQAGGRKLTKKEFLNLPAMKSCKSNINVCGILLYIIGGLNMIVAVLLWHSFPIDGIALVLLGLGVHLGRSRVCALICVAYSIFNVIYLAMQTTSSGSLRGWWIVLVAVYAVIYTFKYHSAWSKYQRDGVLPVEK